MRHHPVTLRTLAGTAAMSALALLAAACGGDTEPTATISSGEPTAVTTGDAADTTADDTTADDTTAADDTATDDTANSSDPTDPGDPTGGGSTGGTTPDGEPIEACTLLTAEDAADALGEDVVPGFVQERDECEWMTEDELRTVQVARLSDELGTWRLDHSTDTFETLDGLGEEAYYGSIFDDVSFVLGEEIYEVDVELRGDGDGRDTAIALAELVEGRL